MDKSTVCLSLGIGLKTLGESLIIRYHCKGTRKGWELIVLHIVFPSSVLLTLTVRYHLCHMPVCLFLLTAVA